MSFDRYPEDGALTAVVRHNCHIADARHAADAGMCTYLLRMRELFRWEQNIPLGGSIDREALGNWLMQREILWEELSGQEFRPLRIDRREFDPFDIEGINRALLPHGLAYSGGLENGARPSFFLAELLDREDRSNGVVLCVTGREHARCVHSAPAMTRGEHIFLRRESLRRYLWEKFETWRWHRPDNALGRALACYPFETALDTALEAMTDCELGAMRAHEQGEHLAGQLLGDDWNRMLLDLAFTPAERMARAVRDHLADCSHTLPWLLEQGASPSIHFFAGNFSAMRKDLFPALLAAYEGWCNQGELEPLGDLATRGAAHWLGLAREMLVLHQALGDGSASAIQQLVEANRL